MKIWHYSDLHVVIPDWPWYVELEIDGKATARRNHSIDPFFFLDGGVLLGYNTEFEPTLKFVPIL